MNLKPGDRVAIRRGEFKSRIATVRLVDETFVTVSLDGVDRLVPRADLRKVEKT